jgi:hypothetical protein
MIAANRQDLEICGQKKLTSTNLLIKNPQDTQQGMLSGIVEFLVRDRTTENSLFVFEAKPLGSLHNHENDPNQAPGLFQLIAGCLVAAEQHHNDNCTVWGWLTDLECGLIVRVDKGVVHDGSSAYTISSSRVLRLFDVENRQFATTSPLILCCLARILMLTGSEDLGSLREDVYIQNVVSALIRSQSMKDSLDALHRSGRQFLSFLEGDGDTRQVLVWALQEIQELQRQNQELRTHIQELQLSAGMVRQKHW